MVWCICAYQPDEHRGHNYWSEASVTDTAAGSTPQLQMCLQVSCNCFKLSTGEMQLQHSCMLVRCNCNWRARWSCAIVTSLTKFKDMDATAGLLACEVVTDITAGPESWCQIYVLVLCNLIIHA